MKHQNNNSNLDERSNLHQIKSLKMHYNSKQEVQLATSMQPHIRTSKIFVSRLKKPWRSRSLPEVLSAST